MSFASLLRVPPDEADRVVLAHRVAKGGFLWMLPFLTLSVVPALVSPVEADSIHVTFYAAVAGILPMLMIAGMVQLAELRGQLATAGREWQLATLVLTAAIGEGAALLVLATGHSTWGTLMETALALWVQFWIISTTILRRF